MQKEIQNRRELTALYSYCSDLAAASAIVTKVITRNNLNYSIYDKTQQIIAQRTVNDHR